MSINKIPLSGRENLSVTIFMPHSCSNNCKFCTSKDDYHIHKGNLEAVLKSIRKTSKTKFFRENVKSFVITGGEPFASLDALEKILNAIPEKYPVYVNTTGPTNVYSAEELIDFINHSRITGINISRHKKTYKKDTEFFSPNILKDEDIAKIHRSVKINVLTTEKTDIKAYIDRWKKYNNVYLSFRADYRKITKDNLRSLSEPIINNIYAFREKERCKHVHHGGCDVCFDITFLLKTKKKPFYFGLHRGLEHSSFIAGPYLFINDIIIHQDGLITYDWDRNSKLKTKGI